MGWSRSRRLGPGIAPLLAGLALARAALGAGDSALSTEPRPYDVEGVPDRPRPLLELGERFLGTGPLGEGITLPTGAVWRWPSLAGPDSGR